MDGEMDRQISKKITKKNNNQSTDDYVAGGHQRQKMVKQNFKSNFLFQYFFLFKL